MNKKSYQFIKKILVNAHQIPVEEQFDYVKKSCKDYPELVSELMGMLSRQGSEAFNDMEKPAMIHQMPELDSDELENGVILADNSQFGQYEIIKKIGAGGMGVVYQAQQDFPAQRQVALKILKNIPNQQLLIKETQILALLNHPNIATLYEVASSKEGQLYLAMEFIDGTDIVTWCKNYSVNEIIELFLQLCSSISYAHEKGIIHCDIKPNNVLVMNINNKATIKVIDFGISQYINQKIEPNEISGTPSYLAPEVLKNDKLGSADTRRDVYALGILLKKLLPSNIPKDLKHIIDKASALEKQHRYASSANISYDLNNYINKLPILYSL